MFNRHFYCRSERLPRRLMDLNPYNAISSGTMWTSENLADQGIIGIYNVLRSANIASDLYKYDAFGVSASPRNSEALLSGNITASNALFSDYWQIHYEGISRANDAIINLPNAPLEEGKRNRLLAEAKFSAPSSIIS